MSSVTPTSTGAPEPTEEKDERRWSTPTPPNDEENPLPLKDQPKSDGKDPNLVGWDGDDDKENPRNWSSAYKSWITFQLGMLALAASLNTSIIAPAENTIAAYVGVSSEVAVLMVSLNLLGFAFGPIIWAPVSEVWGRRISMLPPMFLLAIFSIGTAVSRNAQSVFLTRFFAGVCGSAPVANVSAALGDIWSPKARGTAVVFYAIAVVGGPTLGPTIGAALLVNPHLGWRWTQYIEAIWVFAISGLGVFAFPEMYPPVLLKWKAQRLRKETGNQALYHPHERLKLSFKEIITKHFSRPILMLLTEPMVTCIALYASFVYGLLFMTLEVFPIVFEEHRRWKPVVASLPFLGLFVGVISAVGVNLANQPRYKRISDAAQGRPVPEARLAPMAVGGIFFAIGLFCFGWTAANSIPWIVPVIATVFIGAGFNIIFQQCINFLVDMYVIYAASAVAANTILRSLLAASFPLVAKPMFHNLGVGPAMSILGGIAAIANAAPFIFMKYGLALRKMSKFAPVHD